jgi:diguanylate cyclase (GGDEF)-like protein
MADPSLQDLATGLGNRRGLLASLRERMPSQSGALILLDIDAFGRTTEGLERRQLDAILKEAAGRLIEAAGEGGLLYRYGGDSFCLLVPDADRDKGAAAAEKLRGAVDAKPFMVDAKVMPLTASASVASYPMDGKSPAGVIEAAERALLVAKHQGQNKIAVAGRLDPVALAEIGIFRGLPCPILVGRVAEQSRLRQLATDIRNVGPAVATVTGGPGVGKSRLLHELAVWARTEKFIVLTATSQESRSTAPYSTLADQFETLMLADRALVLKAMERVSPEHRASLAIVLRDLPPEWSGAKQTSGDLGKLIFEAFGGLFEELSRTAPILAIVDEVEFSDAATFEVYRAAINRKLPILVTAGTNRPPTDFEIMPSGAFWKDFSAGAARINLLPLPAEDLRQMIRGILPDAEISNESIARLIVASQGNPLYLEETVRSLLLRGRMKQTGGRWALPELAPTDLSRDLAGAIRAVAESLPHGANSLLTRAAVIGTRFDPELLQEVLGEGDTEMLDLIDEVRRTRLLVPSESGQDLLSFSAAHARRVRLQSSDATEQKEIHGRVGVVQEARHGGDIDHIADEIAFHYSRAGQDAKARQFDEVAQKRAALIQPPVKPGVRRPRLPAVTTALAASATEQSLALMRHFMAAVKIGRLYPQWSQVGTTFLAQLRGALEALLTGGPGLTFSVTTNGPAINAVLTDVPVAADFARLLDERLIEAVTILPSFEIQRIETVVRTFTEPFDRVRATQDYWERFLAREAMEAIDIVQKAYQARESMRRTRMDPADKAVPPDDLPAVRDAMRFLKAAVDNLKRYPPGHTLVEETTAQCVRSLLELLRKVPAVAWGTAEGELVLNGQATDAKYFSDAGAWLVKEIDQRKIKSVLIGRGLMEDEIRALISYFSLSAEEAMQPGAGERLFTQFTHIAFGARAYERATDEESGGGPIHPPPKPVRSEIRAREHLARVNEEFLTPDLERQFPLLVEALAYGAGRPVAEQLVDRLGTHFHHPSLSHRTRAFNLLTRSIAFASPGTRKLAVMRSASSLKMRLSEDTEPLHVRAAVNLLPVWIPAAAASGCLGELAEIAGRTLRRRADSPATPPEVAAVCESALLLIPQSTAFDAICAAVRKPSEDDRNAAITILLAVGGPTVEKLVDILAEEPDVRIRRAIALSLSASAERLSVEIVRLIPPDAPLERTVRVLQVIEPLLTGPVSGHLALLAEKGSADLRGVILKSAETWPRSVVAGIVRRLLASSAPELRDAGIEAAAQMKIEAVKAEVGRILEGATDERLMILCASYFRQVPNPAVVSALTKIAQTRPKFFGLVKGYAEETRAAAVLALAAQGTKQAEDAVSQAVADPRIRDITRIKKIDSKP